MSTSPSGYVTPFCEAGVTPELEGGAGCNPRVTFDGKNTAVFFAAALSKRAISEAGEGEESTGTSPWRCRLATPAHSSQREASHFKRGVQGSGLVLLLGEMELALLLKTRGSALN